MVKRPAPAPRRAAPDLTRAEFAREPVSMHDLYLAALRSGAREVKNRRFTRCLIEGPAVLLLAQGVSFDDCDLGDAAGNVATLLLKPMSPERVTGAVPLIDCVFESCQFVAIGFTGSDATLEMMHEITGSPRPE